MAELEIRASSDEDLAQVEPLVEDALGRLRTLRGGAQLLETLGVPGDIEAGALAAALCGGGLPEATTLVATLDGPVVGLAVAARTDEGLDLLGVHTARSLRRRRIGSELLAAVRALAAAQDLRFEALALPGDQTFKSLLEHAGFRARMLRMSADR